MRYRSAFLMKAVFSAFLLAEAAYSQEAAGTIVFGPYNAEFLSAGLEHRGNLSQIPQDHWSVACWIFSEAPAAHTLIGGFGDPAAGSSQNYLALDGGRSALWLGEAGTVVSQASLPRGGWQHVAATYDGSTARLYVNGTRQLHTHRISTTQEPLA